MNKNNVLELILAKYEKDAKIEKKLLEEIRTTIDEIEVARSMFNNVDDQNLIEAAIYKEESAKRKCNYLFKVAKESYKYEKVQ